MNRHYAIALSHLPHFCKGTDEPLQNLRHAVLHTKETNTILVTSFGALHWDLQLSLAQQHRIPVKLIVPASMMKENLSDYLAEQFGPLQVKEIIRTKSIQERDQVVIECADMIFPVWIRSGGRIGSLLKKNQARTDNRFLSTYRFRQRVKYETGPLSESIKTLPENYLWHWTRSSEYPWPDETITAFCHDLLNAHIYPRSALSTLERIVASRKLIASGKRITGKIPVVSFTENHPARMVCHFTWRTGRHRMNFEPYGIGFPRNYLENRGAVKTRYNKEPAWDTLSSGNNWVNEHEWRVRGDLMFSNKIVEKIIVIVRQSQEKIFFKDYNVYSYEGPPK